MAMLVLRLSWVLCILLVYWYSRPSIVEPAIAAITYANAEVNLNLLQQGMHADKISHLEHQMFIVTMGGTGATLVVPFMFKWLRKIKTKSCYWTCFSSSNILLV